MNWDFMKLDASTYQQLKPKQSLLLCFLSDSHELELEDEEQELEDELQELEDEMQELEDEQLDDEEDEQVELSRS